jgi:S-adenosylmethionine uptake transporter
MQSLWMILASFMFAAMGVGIKISAQSMNVAELLFWRGVVSTVVTAFVMQQRGVSFGTRVPVMHLWRSVLGASSMAAWFYAIAHLPLATAMTLNYMSGVWMAAFVVVGALIGRGMRASSDSNLAAQGPLAASVMLAFCGVVLVLRPTFAQDQWLAGLVGLGSGLGAALAYFQLTALARTGEPVSRTVFYFGVGTLVTGAVGMGMVGITPLAQVAPAALWWILPIGLLASVGQWFMTLSYSRGPTLVAANLQYSGIVFAALLGLALFGDRIPSVAWGGIALIVVSGIAATVLRERASTLAQDSSLSVATSELPKMQA